MLLIREELGAFLGSYDDGTGGSRSVGRVAGVQGIGSEEEPAGGTKGF